MRTVTGMHDGGHMSIAGVKTAMPGGDGMARQGEGVVLERAECFECLGAALYGVLSLSAHPGRRGVVIVVGGPQYRAGSHRQFTLLARSLAAAGIAVLRFDYRGMGDSEGAARSFEDINDDVRAAVDNMFDMVPGLDDVVLW